MLLGAGLGPWHGPTWHSELSTGSGRGTWMLRGSELATCLLRAVRRGRCIGGSIHPGWPSVGAASTRKLEIHGPRPPISSLLLHYAVIFALPFHLYGIRFKQGPCRNCQRGTMWPPAARTRTGQTGQRKPHLISFKKSAGGVPGPDLPKPSHQLTRPHPRLDIIKPN